MSGSVSFSRIPRLLLGIGIALTFLIAAAPVRAQQDSPAADGSLQVIDAHIEGTGPWTSIFGAAPDRELVINITNIGSVPIETPELVLRFGKGANPTASVAPPQIGRLEPGESTVVRTALDLPSFAYGTYAVEGTFPGFDPPVQFRAETSQIPWLLFLAPLLILIQLGLVMLRNAVRRRIHAPAHNIVPRPNESPAEIPDITREMIDLRAGSIEPEPIVEPEPQPIVELDTIIGEELGVAFGRAFMNHGECSDDGEFGVLVVSLTNAAAERVAERAQLSRSERDVLGFEMAQAVLATFDLPVKVSI